MHEIKDLNASVQSVLAYVHLHIKKDTMNPDIRNTHDIMLVDKDINKRNIQGTLRDEMVTIQHRIMKKKISLQVATTLIATILQPNISAIVAPNPLESTQSSNQSGDETTNNDINITNNINNNHTSHAATIENQSIEHPLIRNINDNLNPSTTEAHQLSRCNQPQPPTHRHQNAFHQRQYLISHFFTAQQTTSTNISQTRATEIINNTATNNNSCTSNNNNSQELTLSTLIKHSNNIFSYIPDSVSNSAITSVRSRRKNYVQQRIRKQPNANDYWGSSMDTNNPRYFRIYFQNINGLKAGRSMERWLKTVKRNVKFSV
jgi:hypothetical protein